MSNFFFGGLPTLGQRRAAGQKAVGPTSAAIVGPTDVPTLAQRQHAIWVDVKLTPCTLNRILLDSSSREV